MAACACGCCVLLPFMIFVLFPFYWVLITSFKTTPQISGGHGRSSGRTRATIEQYRSLLQDTPFLIWLGNSVMVAVVSDA